MPREDGRDRARYRGAAAAAAADDDVEWFRILATDGCLAVATPMPLLPGYADNLGMIVLLTNEDTFLGGTPKHRMANMTNLAWIPCKK